MRTATEALAEVLSAMNTINSRGINGELLNGIAGVIEDQEREILRARTYSANATLEASCVLE